MGVKNDPIVTDDEAQLVTDDEVQSATPWIIAIAGAPKWPLTAGAVILFLGLFVLFKYPPTTLFWKVVAAGITELGFAFVIAWVVLATLEVRSRDAHEAELMARNRQFQDQISEREELFAEHIKNGEKTLNKNIFDYIYSVRLPKELFLNVEKHIFQSPFIKDFQRIEYNFLKRLDSWILIRGEFEYLVTNVSRDPQDFHIKFFIEKELGTEPPFDELGYYKAIIGDRTLTHKQISEADCNAKDSEEYQQFECTERMEPGQKIKVRLGFYLRKRTTDSELWQSIHLCSNLSVRVNYDPEDFDLHITPVHPVGEFPSMDRDEFGVQVELNEPLLKGNGVFLWWAPKSTDSEPALLTLKEGAGTEETKVRHEADKV